RSKGRPDLLREKLRLLPCGEVPAFVQPAVVNEFWVGLLCPAPRSGVELIWKDADGYGDRDVLGCEKVKLVLPIQTRRRDRRIRKPVKSDVVEDVIARQAFGLTGKDTRDQRLAGCVVIDHPGCEAGR